MDDETNIDWEKTLAAAKAIAVSRGLDPAALTFRVPDEGFVVLHERLGGKLPSAALKRVTVGGAALDRSAPPPGKRIEVDVEGGRFSVVVTT